MTHLEPIKVLFVCLGNICRSPMAEGIFRQIVKKEGLINRFQIDSAGTSRYHIDEIPDQRTIRACSEKGIQLDHLGKELIPIHLEDWDYILAMDNSNFENIQILKNKTKGNHKAQIIKMRDFDLMHKGKDVPDPYYGGMDGFYEVFDMLERSSYELLRYIRREHSI